MKTIKHDGFTNGLYSYYADNHDNIKILFSTYFKTNKDSVKIAFRREDLELMVLVKIKNMTPDAIIMFTVNRLDEYRFNYDNEELLHLILEDFKLGSRCKKLSKIKNRISDVR